MESLNIGPRLGALASMVLVGAVAAVGMRAGLPVGVAVPLAMALVAAALLMLGHRLGPATLPLGIVWLLFAGLGTLHTAVKAFGAAVGGVVGVAVLAVVAALVVAARRGHRQLRVRAGGDARRRFAEGRGLRFEPRAEVPVPGPYSAALFVSVPTEARHTTGEQVVTGEVRGRPVTVFHRGRPGRENETQTVWLVRLPVRLPYVSSAFVRQVAGGAVAGEELAAHLVEAFFVTGTRAPEATEDLVRALLTPATVAAIRGMGYTPWWVEGEHLCCAIGAAAGGVPADVVGDRLDRLTDLAASMPWPQLSGYPAPAAVDR